MKRPFMVGERLYLRALEPADLEGPYAGWLNDYEITRFLETGSVPTTPAQLARYYETVSLDPNTVLLAIVEQETDAHIGNIKLGPIHRLHRHADLGVLIGAKKVWGKGYAGEAVGMMVAYGFKRLNLHKITLGVYADHAAAIRVYERAGFTIEGRLREELFRDGAFHDKVVMGILRSEYEQRLADGTR